MCCLGPVDEWGADEFSQASFVQPGAAKPTAEQLKATAAVKAFEKLMFSENDRGLGTKLSLWAHQIDSVVAEKLST